MMKRIFAAGMVGLPPSSSAPPTARLEGVKGVLKDLEIKDAFLDRKTLTYWQDDIDTTVNVCMPCPPGY